MPLLNILNPVSTRGKLLLVGIAFLIDLSGLMMGYFISSEVGIDPLIGAGVGLLISTSILVALLIRNKNSLFHVQTQERKSELLGYLSIAISLVVIAAIIIK